MVQPLWKIVWQFLTRVKVRTHTIQSSNHTPWYLAKGFENLCLHRNLHTCVHRKFIHNCQKLEATKLSFSRWMDNCGTYSNGMLIHAKEKWGSSHEKTWRNFKCVLLKSEKSTYYMTSYIWHSGKDQTTRKEKYQCCQGLGRREK